MNGSSVGPKFIKQVTVDASHCTGGNPYDSFQFSGKDTSLENLLLGQGTIVGLRVGGEQDVDNVTINGVQVGTMASGVLGLQCGGGATSTTLGVLLDTFHSITNTTLLSIGTIASGTGGTATNIIRDCKNSNIIPRTFMQETTVAQYSVGPSGGFVLGTSRSERAQVSLLSQSSSIPSTTLFTPTSAKGTNMLALCLWIQNTAATGSVMASVSYGNGTTTLTDSTTTIPFSSTGQHSCTVISQHVVSGTDVKYSTTVSGTTAGTYGLDIVDTQVQ